MSELVWLTLAAVAVFLVLLVPANYLLGLLWTRARSNRTPIQVQMISVQSFVVRSSTHYVIPNSCPVQPIAKTKASGVDQLAAA
jgi:hypothetical protein